MSNTDHRWATPINAYCPAPSSLFANRRRELAFYREGLAQGLDARGPGSWKLALLGSWGIGKTSLLRKFASLTDDADPPALSVIVTVKSGMKGLDGLAADLLSRIQAALVGHLDWPDALRREFSRWEPTLRAGPLSAVRRSQDPTVTGGSLLFRELTILLDDAHQLLAHDESVLMALHAVFRDLQGTRARYPLIIAGPETLFEAVHDLSEPVTCFFDRMALSPFSLEATAEAVRNLGPPLEPLWSSRAKRSTPGARRRRVMLSSPRLPCATSGSFIRSQVPPRRARLMASADLMEGVSDPRYAHTKITHAANAIHVLDRDRLWSHQPAVADGLRQRGDQALAARLICATPRAHHASLVRRRILVGGHRPRPIGRQGSRRHSRGPQSLAP